MVIRICELKELCKRAIRTSGFEIHRIQDANAKPLDPIEERIAKYLAGGRIPWSEGYIDYRRRFLSQTLDDQRLVSAIAMGDTVPDGYGYKLCERCVEYPWCIYNIRPEDLAILDAGSTLNHEFMVTHPALADKNLTITTLSPEPQCHWKRGISYVFGDLRNLIFRDECFDLVVCISTLEHVGMDNSLFDAHGVVVPDRNSHLDAIRELRRVLRPGGRLLLTVPYGRDPMIPETLVFSAPMIDRVIATFRPVEIQCNYYKYSAAGWRAATAGECETAEYETWVMRANVNRTPRFPTTSDGAAAARAVCCISLTR